MEARRPKYKLWWVWYLPAAILLAVTTWVTVRDAIHLIRVDCDVNTMNGLPVYSFQFELAVVTLVTLCLTLGHGWGRRFFYFGLGVLLVVTIIEPLIVTQISGCWQSPA